MFSGKIGKGKGNVLDQYARFVSAQYPMLLCLVVLVPFSRGMRLNFRFEWQALVSYPHHDSAIEQGARFGL